MSKSGVATIVSAAFALGLTVAPPLFDLWKPTFFALSLAAMVIAGAWWLILHFGISKGWMRVILILTGVILIGVGIFARFDPLHPVIPPEPPASGGPPMTDDKKSPPPQTFNVTSHSQQGGVTAGVVNMHTPVWEMSQRQYDSLVSNLASIPRGRVRIICESPEGQRVYDAMVDAFNANKWHIAAAIRVGVTPGRGFRCNAPDGQHDLARLISDAFTRADMPVTCVVGGAAPFDINEEPALTIWLGTAR